MAKTWPALLEDIRSAAGGTPRLYVPGGPAEPSGLAAALKDAPHLAAGATFVGVWLPGINRTAWAGLAPDAKAESTFLYADHRTHFEAGRFRLLPLHYSAAWDWLKTVPLDAAFTPVSKPDDRGRVSLALGTDLSPALTARKDVRLVAVIRPDMPAPATSPHLPLDTFADVVEDESPLITLADPPLSEEARAIAGHVAGLLGDGATVQSGIGSVQQIAM
ncbi:MAG: hypothetical protein KDA53_10575, partial [Hyphomonas sp.]|nr:hypothetical protein [Hyphomonas sp.]